MYKKSVGMFRSIVISIFIHVSLIAPIVISYYYNPRKMPKQSEKLIISIDGIISNQQQEKTVAKEETQPPPPKPKPQPVPKPKEIKQPTPVKNPIEKIEKQKQEEMTHEDTPAIKQEEVIKSDINQEAQTIDDEKKEQEEINKYLVELKKRLAPNINYPQEARKKGYIGIPIVTFNIQANGEVLKESIYVSQTSGSIALDEAAKEAIMKSSPFLPPPKVLNDISIEIYFRVK